MYEKWSLETDRYPKQIIHTFNKVTRSAACSNVKVDISSTIRLIVASFDLLAAGGGGGEGVFAAAAAAVSIHLDEEEEIVLEDLCAM